MKKINTLCTAFLLTAAGLQADQDPWKGDEYAKNSESQKQSAQNFMQGFRLKGNERVLDVGCGDGKVTDSMARLLPNGSILGVDVSPSMVDFAQKAFPHQKNLAFLVKDAAHLDFGRQFDIVTSFTVLHWVLDQPKALTGIEKALKLGGSAWIQMPGGLPESLQQAVDDTIADEKWEEYFVGFTLPWKFYTVDEYKNLLVQAHLTPVRVEMTLNHELFPSREAFLGFIRQWFPYLRPLPVSLKEPFLNEVMDRYSENLPLENGKVSFIVERLEAHAVKPK